MPLNKFMKETSYTCWAFYFHLGKRNNDYIYLIGQLWKRNDLMSVTQPNMYHLPKPLVDVSYNHCYHIFLKMSYFMSYLDVLKIDKPIFVCHYLWYLNHTFSLSHNSGSHPLFVCVCLGVWDIGSWDK